MNNNKNIPCKAILVSEVIINRCIDEKLPLNTSKLQKILYFMQKEHLNMFGIPVFDEEILPGECGPIVPSVRDYFVDGRIGFENKVEQSIILKESHKKALDNVLNQYGKLTPSEMSKISQDDLP